MKTRTLSAATSFLLLTCAFAFAQNVEITGYVGGQVNGGLSNLQTPLFDRLEVDNSTNYGISLGYLLGEHGGVEFQWNHTQSETVAEPIGGGANVNLFSLTQNQYMGNFLFHATSREHKMRPYLLLGLGATNFGPDRSGVNSATKFTWAIGGGAKYNMGKHFGLRGQLRYAPTYITTTNTGGYWCDPFWGGCWVAGESHYLHEFDITGGITFRF